MMDLFEPKFSDYCLLKDPTGPREHWLSLSIRARSAKPLHPLDFNGANRLLREIQLYFDLHVLEQSALKLVMHPSNY